MRRVASAEQLHLFPLTSESSLPRWELLAQQGGRCAGCDAPLSSERRVSRDRWGTRIAAVTCHGCSLRTRPLPAPTPVEQARPLLRLRLTQGPTPSADLVVTDEDRAALASREWDHFRNPLHALWAYQGGTCALDHPTINPHGRLRGRHIRLDHQHDAEGLIRGLLCQSCNCLEGKSGGGAKGPAMRALIRQYRRQPPAQSFDPTRGLTRRYLIAWPRERYNQWRLGPPRVRPVDFFSFDFDDCA